MGDMIERVAKALKSAMQDSGAVSLVANGPNGEAALEQFFEVLAMDAIEAMREPTDEMKDAPTRFILTKDEGKRLEYFAAYRCYIDAALNKMDTGSMT